MTSAVVAVGALCLVLVLAARGAEEPQPVTDTCLGCICRAASGCRLQQCEGDRCGLFHITWAYWADAGRPTLPGGAPEDPDAYRACAVDPYCAARAVQGYMTKYSKDCNGDGKINCYDYLAMHKLGGYGCGGVAELPARYVAVFNQCIQEAADRG